MLNEEKNASLCVESVIKEIIKIESPIKLLIVDDGSADMTSHILKQKEIKYRKKLTVITHKKNLGYGSALQTGIRYAIKNRFDFYLTMDSDLTNPPKHIKEFIEFTNSSLDCIKASRYVRGGRVVNVSFFRQFVSIVGNKIASILFGVGLNDCTNGFKMVKLSFLKGVRFKEKNFSIILEELYYLKIKKAKFGEIPNVLYARRNSKSHFVYDPKIFFDYFKYVLKASVV